MLKISLKGTVQPVIDFLKNLLQRSKDLSSMEDVLVAIMVRGNEEGLLNGVGADGGYLLEISEWTRRTRDGDGPPLVPQYAGAMAIEGFIATAEDSETQLIVRGVWIGQDYLRYHKTGYVNHLTGRWVPPRDILGVRPETVREMYDAVGKEIISWGRFDVA